MAYASWSVVFGEQPTASKWNILGANDASFNDGTGIDNLAIGNGNTSLSNGHKFAVYRNAAANSGSGAFAKVAFDTELFDTGGNISSGTFTAPVAGFYQFNASVNFTAGTATITSLFKNSSEYYRGEQKATSGSNPVAALIQLAVNDTVEVHAFGNTALALGVGSTTLTWFNGYLVSQT